MLQLRLRLVARLEEVAVLGLDACACELLGVGVAKLDFPTHVLRLRVEDFQHVFIKLRLIVVLTALGLEIISCLVAQVAYPLNVVGVLLLCVFDVVEDLHLVPVNNRLFVVSV